MWWATTDRPSSLPKRGHSNLARSASSARQVIFRTQASSVSVKRKPPHPHERLPRRGGERGRGGRPLRSQRPSLSPSPTSSGGPIKPRAWHSGRAARARARVCGRRGERAREVGLKAPAAAVRTALFPPVGVPLVADGNRQVLVLREKRVELVLWDWRDVHAPTSTPLPPTSCGELVTFEEPRTTVALAGWLAPQEITRHPYNGSPCLPALLVEDVVGGLFTVNSALRRERASPSHTLACSLAGIIYERPLLLYYTPRVRLRPATTTRATLEGFHYRRGPTSEGARGRGRERVASARENLDALSPMRRSRLPAIRKGSMAKRSMQIVHDLLI